jgi:hypothetical protein
MLEHWHSIFPLLGTYFYLNFPKSAVEHFSPSTITNFALVHNAFLQLFSMYIAATLTYALFKEGIVPRTNYYFEKDYIKTAMFYFYLSKYYEYIDTFILYAKKKTPIFLQTFHHSGAVIVWHLGYVYKTDGLFFVCLLNSYVHSFMYLYYFLTLLKVSVHKCKIYITSMQIAQLAFGAIALPLFYYEIETQQNKRVICAFDIYIICLLVLFGKFMLDNYYNKVKSD